MGLHCFKELYFRDILMKFITLQQPKVNISRLNRN